MNDTRRQVNLITSISRTVLCALILAHVCCAEPFFLNRDHSDINLHDKQDAESQEKVQTEADCEMYLCDYGYLNCSCQPRTIRHKPSTPRDSNVGGTQLSGFPFNLGEFDVESENQNVLPNCTANDITEAYMRLQKRFKLPETGRCDQETQKKMNKPRCGNKDIDLTHENELDHADRPGVTLSSILKPSQTLPNSRGSGAHERRRRDIMAEMARKDEEMKALGLERRFDKPEEHANRLERRSRKKRSATSLLNKGCIKWRLSTTYQSVKIPEYEQRFALALAFRLWSEVTPLRFEEDLTSHMDDIDVFIAFVYDDHLNCVMSFDGPKGVLAHVIRNGASVGVQNNLGDIHFDDAEPFIYNHQSNGVSLLLVAAHEIGHVLGLPHLPQINAIMFGNYEDTDIDQIELSDDDRLAIREIAGICRGSFSTVFDWVRWDSATSNFVYNTYFMRDEHYWMYQNQARRPRYGDPLRSMPFWGVENVDGFLQVWLNVGNFDLKYYFFVADKVSLYDAMSDQVAWTKPIQEIWPGMYTNIDSAFYDYRDKSIYIFKGDKIQIFDAATNTLLRNTTICEQFPAAPNVDNLDYCQGIDAVYYSFHTLRFVFFRGEEYWVNVKYNMHSQVVENLMGQAQDWYTEWMFICDVQTTCGGGGT